MVSSLTVTVCSSAVISRPRVSLLLWRWAISWYMRLRRECNSEGELSVSMFTPCVLQGGKRGKILPSSVFRASSTVMVLLLTPQSHFLRAFLFNWAFFSPPTVTLGSPTTVTLWSPTTVTLFAFFSGLLPSSCCLKSTRFLTLWHITCLIVRLNHVRQNHACVFSFLMLTSWYVVMRWGEWISSRLLEPRLFWCPAGPGPIRFEPFRIRLRWMNSIQRKIE